MMFGCNCPECKLLRTWNSIQDSLFYNDHIGDGPLSYYKYKDDEREIAHQRGLKAGLEFRYNELLGYKAL